MCGRWGVIAGTLRYFADRHGTPRAAIEGTQIPVDQLRRFAKREAGELEYQARRPHTPLVLKWKLEYFGFVLESGSEPVQQFTPEMVRPARRTLAEAMARSEAKHVAVHKNRTAVEEIRELYRRSGGQTPRLGQDELTAYYEGQLDAQEVNSVEEFRNARLDIKVNDFVPVKLRAHLSALPSKVTIAEREIEIDYDVEEAPATPPAEGEPVAAPTNIGVARLRLPEKIARTITNAELPRLDRPLRFVVTRGSRGAIRANTLIELQAMLEGPWTPNAMEHQLGHEPEQGGNESERRSGLGKSRSGPRKFGRVGGPKRAGKRGGGGKRR